MHRSIPYLASVYIRDNTIRLTLSKSPLLNEIPLMEALID